MTCTESYPSRTFLRHLRQRQTPLPKLHGLLTKYVSPLSVLFCFLSLPGITSQTATAVPSIPSQERQRRPTAKRQSRLRPPPASQPCRATPLFPPARGCAPPTGPPRLRTRRRPAPRLRAARPARSGVEPHRAAAGGRTRGRAAGVGGEPARGERGWRRAGMRPGHDSSVLPKDTFPRSRRGAALSPFQNASASTALSQEKRLV